MSQLDGVTRSKRPPPSPSLHPSSSRLGLFPSSVPHLRLGLTPTTPHRSLHALARSRGGVGRAPCSFNPYASTSRVRVGSAFLFVWLPPPRKPSPRSQSHPRPARSYAPSPGDQPPLGQAHRRSGYPPCRRGASDSRSYTAAARQRRARMLSATATAPPGTASRRPRLGMATATRLRSRGAIAPARAPRARPRHRRRPRRRGTKISGGGG